MNERIFANHTALTFFYMEVTPFSSNVKQNRLLILSVQMIRFKSAGMYTSSIIKLNYYPKVFGFLCDSSKRTLSYLGRLSPIHLFLVDTWNG